MDKSLNHHKSNQNFTKSNLMNLSIILQNLIKNKSSFDSFNKHKLNFDYLSEIYYFLLDLKHNNHKTINKNLSSMFTS